MKLLFFCLTFSLIYLSYCKRSPFRPNFENAGGYVIGKETCNTDTSLDYWLIDLSIYPIPNNYGDSLTLNGIPYHHVVKTNVLLPQFKFLGARVGFDFHLSPSPMQTLNCNAPNPATYYLKVMEVLNQGEVR